uniref:Uncharacterized protein n=1 Tax=viral metagenome TaxID=1070528 RepID=A0A6C0LAF8_9ZZZZ
MSSWFSGNKKKDIPENWPKLVIDPDSFPDDYVSQSRDLINSPDTRIWYATAIGDIDMVRFLCENTKGDDPNFFMVGIEDQNTALHLAANSLNRDIVKLLLDSKRVNIDAVNKNGRTALETMVDLHEPDPFSQEEYIKTNDIAQSLIKAHITKKFRPRKIVKIKPRSGGKRKSRKLRRKTNKRRKSGKRSN